MNDKRNVTGALAGAVLVAAVAMTVLNSEPPTRQVLRDVLVCTDYYPLEDSYTTTQYPDTPYGDAVYVVVSDPNESASAPLRYAFFKFEVPPTGFVSVTLYAYNGGGINDPLDFADVQAHAVADDSWSEATLTWNNQPALGDVLDTVVDINEIEWPAAWDVTDYINDEVAAAAITTTIGLSMYNTGDWQTRTLYSSEMSEASRPRLSVCGNATSTPTPTPTNTATATPTATPLGGLPPTPGNTPTPATTPNAWITEILASQATPCVDWNLRRGCGANDEYVEVGAHPAQSLAGYELGVHDASNALVCSYDIATDNLTGPVKTYWADMMTAAAGGICAGLPVTGTAVLTDSLGVQLDSRLFWSQSGNSWVAHSYNYPGGSWTTATPSPGR
jgi:hypothetical protein